MFHEFKRILKAILLSLGVFAGFLTLLIIGVLVYESFTQDQRVAGLLNIKEPPTSLKVIECESPFGTDIIVVCAVKIEPKEFHFLLEGYDFKKREINRTSHSVANYKLATEFEITEEYYVEPEHFKSGGLIKVATNSQHNKAIVHYYEE